MKIEITGTEKEIAGLVLELQNRHSEDDYTIEFLEPRTAFINGDELTESVLKGMRRADERLKKEPPADDKELSAVLRNKEVMASIIAGVTQAVQTTIDGISQDKQETCPLLKPQCSPEDSRIQT